MSEVVSVCTGDSCEKPKEEVKTLAKIEEKKEA